MYFLRVLTPSPSCFDTVESFHMGGTGSGGSQAFVGNLDTQNQTILTWAVNHPELVSINQNTGEHLLLRLQSDHLRSGAHTVLARSV